MVWVSGTDFIRFHHWRFHATSWLDLLKLCQIIPSNDTTRIPNRRFHKTVRYRHLFQQFGALLLTPLLRQWHELLQLRVLHGQEELSNVASSLRGQSGESAVTQVDPIAYTWFFLICLWATKKNRSWASASSQFCMDYHQQIELQYFIMQCVHWGGFKVVPSGASSSTSSSIGSSATS